MIEKKPRLWTSKDVMEYLGIKKSMYYTLLARDELPGKVKIGSETRFIPELFLAGIKKKAV